MARAANCEQEALGFTSGVSGVIIEEREVPFEVIFPEIR
jgi:hypothetical protein